MATTWDSFFVAQVGGSAALTGLVFVALSINLARILEHSQLVERAGEAVILLVAPMVVGLAALVPDISLRTTGALCLVVAVFAEAIVNRLLIKGRLAARDRPSYEFRTRLTVAELAMAPTLVGAILLLTSSTAGYDWIALGVVLSLLVGIFDAWVLLVEIMR